MALLRTKGTTKILGIEVPIVEGGFGEGKKVLLAKTVAEIHNVRVNDVNDLIKGNIDEFEFEVDIIDLKSATDTNGNEILKDLGFTQNSLNASKNIYLLSEQGYMTLVMLMRTDKAKEIRKEMRRSYFNMREIINSDEQMKAMALLKVIEGKSIEDRIAGVDTYSRLRVKEETNVLTTKITVLEDENEKILKYIARNSGLVTKKDLADRLDTTPTRICRVLKHLGIYTKVKNEISTKFRDKYKNTKLVQLKVNEYGVDWQWTAEGSVIVVKELLDAGFVYETKNGAFKMIDLNKIKEIEQAS